MYNDKSRTKNAIKACCPSYIIGNEEIAVNYGTSKVVNATLVNFQYLADKDMDIASDPFC